MKRTFLFLLLATTVFAGKAQTAYLNCDFSNGIPENFTLVDVDGLMPSTDMQNIGFAIGTPWIAYTFKDGQKAACSTSWYQKEGTSNDWLVTPTFTVTDANAVLKWRAMSHDVEYADGYAVYIACASTPEEFLLTEPVFSTKAEESTWQQHHVSLGDYYGKTISVAFVNNTTDGNRLYLDDIYAGPDAPVFVSKVLNDVVFNTDTIRMQACVFTTNPGETYKGVTLSVEMGGKKIVEEFPDVEIGYGNPVVLTMSESVEIDYSTPTPYTLTASHNGEYSSAEGMITALHHNVVVEELTGTWCGYCIRGIVNMDRCEEAYPESFIGICAHSGDVMSPEDSYMDAFNGLSISGLPYMVANRNENLSGDPSKMESSYLSALREKPTIAFTSLDATLDADTKTISIESNLIATEDIQDAPYRIAYAILEDSVCVPGNNKYSQQNYYANNEYGEMGGYESMPEVIRDFTFRHVARGMADNNISGYDNSIPTNIHAYDVFSHSVSIPLPDAVLRTENIEVVAMLIDKDGRIANAFHTHCSAVTSDVADILCSAPGNENAYDLQGRRINDIRAHKGLYIMNGKLQINK